jgi:subtilisin family serine protease
LTFTANHPDNGSCALACSIWGDSTAGVLPGEWVLEIRSRVVGASAPVDIWMESSWPFVARFNNHVTEETTISCPGTAHHVMTTAAVHADRPLRVVESSSLGPTRDSRKKPDLCAPGAQVRAACGVTGGTTAMSGTSMAAPHVTGAIALAFSAQKKRQVAEPKAPLFNTNQMRSALKSGLQNSSAWNKAYGFGLLDIEALLRAVR